MVYGWEVALDGPRLLAGQVRGSDVMVKRQHHRELQPTGFIFSIV